MSKKWRQADIFIYLSMSSLFQPTIKQIIKIIIDEFVFYDTLL